MRPQKRIFLELHGKGRGYMEKEDQTGEVIVSHKTIRNLIFVIRGHQVLLDSDLAILYQVETKRLNEAVKRNVARFPEEFRFQLTEKEFDSLELQTVSSLEIVDKKGSKGGRRYLPYVFTEQGIAMLSAVLRSEIAIQVSISIMKAFVAIRKFIVNNAFLFERINEIEIKQLEYKKDTDNKLEQVFNYITGHEESTQKIFFDGQIYDAFSLLVDLIGGAEETIILVDNYVNIDTLNILAKKKENVSVCINTIKGTKLTQKDVENFNKQYPEVNVKYTSVFHDRFLILDGTRAYHIGASIKDAGKKCFAISLLEDSRIIYDILQRLKLEEEEKE